MRGFGDRAPIPLPSGRPVWYESDGVNEILPFHLDTHSTTAMRVPGTPHTWPDAQLAGKTTLATPIGGEYYTNEVGGRPATRPYGMGPRVPMYIVSPWTRGGWVNSEVFDHTSTIRFLEERFGVVEPNITPWHRAVAGDLTSCFDFAQARDGVLPELPDMHGATGEPLVIEGLPPVSLPSEPQLPQQALGLRYARPLPYALHAHARHPLRASQRARDLEITFDNEGAAGAVFHVYDRLHLERLPRRYTVEAGKSLSDVWLTSGDDGRYDLYILGPNGFFRHFTGAVQDAIAHGSPALEVRLTYDRFTSSLELFAWNLGAVPCVLRATPNAYRRDDPFSLELAPFDRPRRRGWSIRANGNWYDFTLAVDGLPGWSRRLAGHLENGRPSISDPALGRT